MAARPPMLLVSADGFLHAVDDLATLKRVSKHHELRNEYMRNLVGVKTKALTTQRKEASNWQLLENVKWLQRVESREIVVSVGGAQNFLDHLEQICSRAGLGDVKAPHHKNLKVLLAQVRVHCEQRHACMRSASLQTQSHTCTSWQNDHVDSGNGHGDDGRPTVAGWQKVDTPHEQLASLKYVNCSICGVPSSPGRCLTAPGGPRLSVC